MGAWLEKDACKKPGKIISLAFDFVVLPADATTLVMPPDDDTGIVLQVEPSITDGQLRTINNLDVDAVLLYGKPEEETGPITWQQLLNWQHCAELLTKPLLISLPAGTKGTDLQMLWDAGISGVVLMLATSESITEIARIRKLIDGLTTPSPHKKRKTDALVPHLEPTREPSVEIDDDEDE